MMQIIRHYFLPKFLVLIFGIFLFACSDCEPLDDPGNTLVITFYNRENLEANEILISQPIELDSFVVMDTKYPLIKIADNSYGVSLPPSSEQLSLQLIYSDTVFKEYDLIGETIIDTLLNEEPDILTISYSNSFEPISPDCGIITRYDNISINSTSFDSAAVYFDFIEDNDSTNIRIFF